MQRLKIWTVLTVLWLCVFFTIERIHEPMNIASFVYVMVSIITVIVLLLPNLTEPIQLIVFATSFILLLILKSLLGYPILGSSLPITVTESFALGFTIFLAGHVNRSIQEFQHAVLNIAGATEVGCGMDFDFGQSEIFRELRLARNYGRPLALMTISPQLEGNERLLDGLVEEIHRKSTRQYVHGKIAKLLSHATDGCATVLGREDHLVVSLPEADARQAEEILARIRNMVRDEFGIELVAGTAAFPDQELTLRGLLDRAEADMRGEHDGVAPSSVEPQYPLASIGPRS